MGIKLGEIIQNREQVAYQYYVSASIINAAYERVLLNPNFRGRGVYGMYDMEYFPQEGISLSYLLKMNLNQKGTGFGLPGSDITLGYHLKTDYQTKDSNKILITERMYYGWTYGADQFNRIQEQMQMEALSKEQIASMDEDQFYRPWIRDVALFHLLFKRDTAPGIGFPVIFGEVYDRDDRNICEARARYDWKKSEKYPLLQS